MKKLEIVEWYDLLSSDRRMELQKEFGNEGVSDREKKFYKWLNKEKKYNEKSKS